MSESDEVPFHERVVRVYRDKGKALVRLARRQLAAEGLPVSRTDAEDIVQDALVIVLTYGPAKEIDNMYGYLCAVVRNRVRDAGRRRGVDSIDLTDRAAEGNKPLWVSDVEEDIGGRLDVEGALHKMSPQQRRLILFSKAVGYTHAELATITGLHKGTVATHIRRATALLASLIIVGCVGFSLWYKKLVTDFQWIDVGSDDGKARITATVNFLLSTPVILVVSGQFLVVAAAWVVQRRRAAMRRRATPSAPPYTLEQLDSMQHQQFELAVRDLMRRDGCADAVQVGGAGDLGADVKATDPEGRRWVIQCKHRRNGLSGSAVGSPDVQVLNGVGRGVHQGDFVVLVSNGRFTRPAIEFARSQEVHLVGRDLLREWASGSRPLWELL
ncbi:restriction endonuclease [Streptomyces lateritius]|uniref:restriction endonuclease n=1 Tax=Streptomyces lateritius TaxID=67313 RepID=UPI001C8CD890|nr:restriction endonuclease [Streptomyces lateritius]MBX9420831.1 restriction endonuclease [Streptomyces lateritius]